MKKKAELIADYEAQIESLYKALAVRDAKIKELGARISMLREELYIKDRVLTEGAENQ